jgi:hypothetical protein
VKSFDSLAFRKAADSGEPLDEVEIDVESQHGNGAQFFVMRLSLAKTLIADESTGGTLQGPPGTRKESITFDCTQIDYLQFPEGPDSYDHVGNNISFGVSG